MLCRLTGRNKHCIILLSPIVLNISLFAIYLVFSSELNDTLLLIDVSDNLLNGEIDYNESAMSNITSALMLPNSSHTVNLSYLNTSSLNVEYDLNSTSATTGSILILPSSNNTVKNNTASNVQSNYSDVKLIEDEQALKISSKKKEDAVAFTRRQPNVISNDKMNFVFHFNNLNIPLIFSDNKLHYQSPSLLEHPVETKDDKNNKEDREFFEDEPFQTKINFPLLQRNPIYARFKINEAIKKRRVHLLIIVSSAPNRLRRRMAIRKTWWKMCKPTNEVIPACIFMTDFLYPGEDHYKELQEESSTYEDLHFQHLEGGIRFGERFLNHMVFAVSNYKFDYFLRIDDDYFLCLENLLHELPLPMVKKFHWGWTHRVSHITRPEESIILFSRDLVETFLLQDPRKMMCSPLADQMIGAWSNYINLRNTFRHDPRLHHHPPARDMEHLNHRKGICRIYIGLHGSYPAQMIKFWKNRGTFVPPDGDLITNSHVCRLKQRYNWRRMGGIWRFQPKLCIHNPIWNTEILGVKNGSYIGRQG